MAEDVKPEVIKKTQDLLGKYFKKPPLTEKLLKKPPFRFLHDIVSAVMNETGFLEGLFTEEELNSENIKNKEAKLAYLTKLIDVVKLTTGINLTVRASKIVSGQEPTKTNELLQAIGKALDKKISSKEAIEKYKKNISKGKSTSRSKSSIGKDERKSSKEVSQKKGSPKEEKSAEQKKQVSNINNATVNEIEINKNENQESRKHAEVKEAPQEKSPQDKVPSSAHKKKSSGAKLKKTPSVSSLDTITSQTNKKMDESNKLKEFENKSKQIVDDLNGETQDHTLNTADTVHLETRFTNNTENNNINENIKSTEPKENEVKNNETPLQNGESSEHTASEVQKSQLENIEIDNFSNSQTSSRPKTSLRPPSSRPISARPAAPRIRGKAELTINEEIMTPMGNISVIVENADTRDDDDAEDMVVMETKGSSSDSLASSNIYKANDQLTQEHGHLVAQILETQKELVNSDNVDVIPKKTNIAWDTSLKRDVVTKEIEKLRNTIQSLTRATNPLGKLLDYFQEDVEIMQKELLDWRNQYQQVNEELKVEKMKTQELIDPMKETLKEIDHNMKTQLDKICQAKLQIIKNDQRIQTLLNGHV